MLSLLQSVLTPFVAAYLATWLALGRFREEKRWERKEQAYSAILEALHHMHRDLSQKWEDIFRGYDISDEKKAELSAKYEVGKNEILRQTDIGNFVISDKAADLLSRLIGELSSSNKYDSYFECIDAAAFAVKKCLDEIKVLGKQDLAEAPIPVISWVWTHFRTWAHRFRPTKS